MLTVRRSFVGDALARAFPERRLFLRSDTETRFVRLSPATQFFAISGSALVVGWTILASAVILMDSVGADGLRDNAAREQVTYEQRLNEMSTKRDTALAEAGAAQERFNAALQQISTMQSELLASETRREELTRGIEIAQANLKKAIAERDAAQTARDQFAARLDGDAGATAELARLDDYQATIDFLASALDSTATQRDSMSDHADEAEAFAEEMILEARLQQDRHDKIFTQLEDALSISVAPLDKMFRSAGLNTDTLLNSVRRGYSGQGGPLTPISFSTKGEAPDETSVRANGIIEKLDRMNLYRLAAAKAPFALPVDGSFRFTSGFGPRWGRMHNGTDFAGAHGTPIATTADGVVTFAGRQSGYGNLVKIKHDFGIETRYAHMSAIHVKVGQRVSRGDRIGDMGNTGRSTGTHLHYEVRVGGKPVNPMTYIKAARNVF
ncbi:Murein DD-endopeptidase MepM [Palleronia abyssalis]|uniref:Murein DD-endopeptidase MepM n=1 Tax=Palleronia abyssalis TaxID=1501240 RepID=A0A2R8BUC8_9RHOB|nr:M23 family metallopeptidase [Palleronia abyssalis]SPJ23733.1 Murein DD-endopeptidase MepM [Palleronia abyssalis]